ncbi:MAG TPA: hydrogenase maturation nickel metallochaperone HypA [Synergistales bacterium]|nr:hydrogenase maturation nickel metallochaperone HypA [Synergistales bacterium]
MHELSLVSSVVGSLEELAMGKGWKRITKVTLKIGKMRQVIPEVMVFSFSVASRGTIMEGSELEILEVPVRNRCLSCGENWEGPTFLCPGCGGSEVETESGMEMDLESVEVEE